MALTFVPRSRLDRPLQPFVTLHLDQSVEGRDTVSPSEGGSRRPKHRLQVGDLVMTKDKAPAGFRGRRGRITETIPSGEECRVEFEDGLLPTTGYLMTRWLAAHAL